MTYLANLRKLGVKSTVLASSLALVACGGGGSDGYYNQSSNSSNNNSNGGGNNSSTDSSTVAESIDIKLKDSNGIDLQQANDNSVVQIAVQVLNADKGGIANKQVRLAISDSDNIGVTSKASLVSTGDNGIAIFEINVPTLTASSGKVQLTAVVDGTTIKQSYTLNIKKTSTIVSDYNLNIQQGVVLNLPQGSTDITATVTDKNGGIKAGESIILTLPLEMQGKFSIATGSNVSTDSQGKAKFTIVANSDLSTDEIQKLVSTSQSLSFKLIDENKAEKTVSGSITFKDISQVVQKLELIKADAPIVAQNGTTTVKVRAKNSNDVALANKKVKLVFTDKSDAYGVTINQSEAITDANGYALFTLQANSSYPVALTQQGINLKAIYSDNAEIFAQDTISVITADTSAIDQLALQRLEIASSYKINAKNDQITITVKGINNKGEAATKGKLTLSLNSEATSNGVSFDGSAEKDFSTATNGYITYTLHTNAKTDVAVAALVQAGITATFKSDNNLTSAVQIAVEDEEKSEEGVGYLAIDPINSAFDYSQDQTINVKVKAIGVKGSALKGENISVSLPALSTAELQSLGLSLTGQASKNTDDTGYATFVYQYKANGSDVQKRLVANGIRITAQSNSSNAQQTTTLNFKAPTDQGTIDLDYLNVDMPGSMVLASGVEQTLQVVVKATGTDGKNFTGQKVGVGLNDAAISNGVSFVSASALQTDANGIAKFDLKVKANNNTELANLIANGITVAIQGTRKDGSAYTIARKIDISQPAVVIPDLANLSFSYEPTVSVLGGEVQVKVVAKDANGNTIANTPLAIALSNLAGSRASLSDTALTTNSKGEATFTVKVAEGQYDASLIKNGIGFAVVGANQNNGDRIQQTGNIQVAIPKDSVNLRLTSDITYLSLGNLNIGKTYQVNVAVKDELGANTGYPVNLSLNPEAIAAGVKLSNDSVLTSANGMVSVSVIIPKDIANPAKQALIDNGIQVKGYITNPKGEKLETTINFTVFEMVNQNSLTITPAKTNLSVEGDRAIVTVTLLDKNHQPLRDQSVTLAANNSAGIIIGNPGSSASSNTSGAPQTLKTDSNGNAFFSVGVDGKTVDADLLIASGIELAATYTDEDGEIATQISRLNVFKPSTQPARYSLRISSAKPTLNVRNDTSDVTVTLVDQNGGGVANQYITLGIDNFNINGALIVGPSGLTTDANGQAVFKIKVDETARNMNYSAATFANDDLRLNASFNETGYLTATQISRIDIVQAVVENPVASIVIGVNPTEVGTSSDGVYYTRNMSVSVTDFDGKPLAKQEVVMDIAPVFYLKGKYSWDLITDALGNQKEDWVIHPTAYCPVNASGSPITNNEVINIPVKVPTFLGQGTTATYTTDAEGKFDFVIRYPKIYAQWLNVQVGASSTVASLPNRTVYNLGLAPLKSDYSTDGSYGPNLTSPYGTNTTCP
ncbi:Ig-like domain-containing protein [Acinetobacter sp. S40]|uniref:Ig-like domain-containing protein n=1 Tax=Acinetobacter sp. S40 TaxID=2767434 RepID=UPI00190C3A92|nr:Ig-like domain-containing protein [Acinetobacter sp. S40]MBJ9986766.1 Ig-like domain-containing protein [Acinetobacter sp. S40]